MGPDAVILVFWMLSFKPTFSLSSLTFIKRLFNSSSLSATRVMSSVYLRLLIFLLASWLQLPLHPAQHFAWCTLHISYVKGIQASSPLHACSFMCLLSCIRLFATPWTVTCQDLLSMVSSSQENEWVAISSSRASSQPRDQACVFCVSCTSRQVLYH